MLFNDGAYQIYIIQHPNSRGGWVMSSLGHFGLRDVDLRGDDGFLASGKCWQTTGMEGTFELEKARRVIAKLRELNPDRVFRIAQVNIMQQTIYVKEP